MKTQFVRVFPKGPDVWNLIKADRISIMFVYLNHENNGGLLKKLSHRTSLILPRPIFLLTKFPVSKI